jgi:hypothetical protein
MGGKGTLMECCWEEKPFASFLGNNAFFAQIPVVPVCA